MFVELSKKRRKAFDNLDSYLEAIKKIALTVDRNSKVFLFGSVAEGNFNLGSDIDVLIITEDKNAISLKLERAGIGFPFELHIRNAREADSYFRHVHHMKRI